MPIWIQHISKRGFPNLVDTEERVGDSLVKILKLRFCLVWITSFTIVFTPLWSLNNGCLLDDMRKFDKICRLSHLSPLSLPPVISGIFVEFHKIPMVLKLFCMGSFLSEKDEQLSMAFCKEQFFSTGRSFWWQVRSQQHSWSCSPGPLCTPQEPSRCPLDRFTKTFFWNFQKSRAVLCYILIGKQMLH